MKKTIIFVLLVTFFASGCSLFKKAPQEAVNDGIAEFADVEKMNSSFNMNGTIQAPPGEKPSKLQFNLVLTGKTDSSEEEKTNVDAKITASFTMDEQKGSGEVLLRMVDGKMYANLSKIDIVVEKDSPMKNLFDSILNKWWLFPTTEESSVVKFTEEQEQLQEKLKTAMLFTNAREEASEDVQGIKSTRYRVDLDKEALKKFILDISKITENELTPEEEIAIGESVQDIDFSGAVWIGDDDMLHRVRGTITMQPKQGPSSSFDIDFSAWDYGKAVEVKKPESAQEFNPLIALPLLGAFGGVDEGELGTSTPAGPVAK